MKLPVFGIFQRLRQGLVRPDQERTVGLTAWA